jgi:hypothetical protein
MLLQKEKASKNGKAKLIELKVRESSRVRPNFPCDSFRPTKRFTIIKLFVVLQKKSRLQGFANEFAHQTFFFTH